VTTHRRWLELAATAPTFATSSGEAAALAAHLATCDACSRQATAFRSDLARVSRLDAPRASEGLRRRIMEAATADEPDGHGLTLAMVAVVGLLAAALLGATLGVGAFLTQRETPFVAPKAEDPLAVPDIDGKAIQWKTDVVRLGADAITIDANGVISHGLAAIKVSSDPGDLKRWTLEAAWSENGVDQRLNLYFAADATTWWIDEVGVYDGVAAGPKWAKLPPGPLARTALGQPFRGDIDLNGIGAGGPVHLRIDGAVLAVAPRPSFVEPVGGGVALTVDPFAPGQPLHCSGILQLRPQQAEQALRRYRFRLSWRLETATGPNTGFSDVRLEPPAGVISGSGIGSNGELIIFVSDPAAPFGKPAGFPKDCPTPAGG
jgi:hypothetical protein